MLGALHESAIVPDFLVGTSAGALNAAFTASQPQTPSVADHTIRNRRCRPTTERETSSAAQTMACGRTSVENPREQQSVEHDIDDLRRSFDRYDAEGARLRPQLVVTSPMRSTGSVTIWKPSTAVSSDSKRPGRSGPRTARNRSAERIAVPAEPSERSARSAPARPGRGGY
jgi:hypothetical protein